MSNPFSNTHTSPVDFSLESFEQTVRKLTRIDTMKPPQLIVSPEMLKLIKTDPVLQQAAEMVLGRRLDSDSP